MIHPRVLTARMLLAATALWSTDSLVVASSEQTAAEATASGVTPASIYRTIQGLAGTWEGKSTKGWTEEVTIKVIAGGSVVVVNSFDAHPGEEMITTYYLDGDDLQLKHYCIAGNQPRLQATSFSEDGRTVTFTFKDATNLPSRDTGHMDKVVYRFADKDHFSSHWTWYQNGEETWMEEIEYRRLGG